MWFEYFTQISSPKVGHVNNSVRKKENLSARSGSNLSWNRKQRVLHDADAVHGRKHIGKYNKDRTATLTCLSIVFCLHYKATQLRKTFSLKDIETSFISSSKQLIVDYWTTFLYNIHYITPPPDDGHDCVPLPRYATPQLSDYTINSISSLPPPPISAVLL